MKDTDETDGHRPEFSRPVVVERIPAEGQACDFEAGPEERQALALRFELLALNRLSVRARLRPLRGGMLRLEGRLGAEVVQDCVVSLEPVEGRIDEPFVVTFRPPQDADKSRKHEVVVSLDDDGPPEPIEDGVIDLGEVAAQQLALAIEPYPRAKGADFAALAAQDGLSGQGRGAPSGPFEALAALKRRR